MINTFLNYQNDKKLSTFLGATIASEKTLHPFITKWSSPKFDPLDGKFISGHELEHFRKDYNWLMAVVEIIEEIEFPHSTFGTIRYDVVISPEAIFIEHAHSDEPIILINKSEGVGSINHEIHNFEDKKEALYTALVLFIDWYNQQPK